MTVLILDVKQDPKKPTEFSSGDRVHKSSKFMGISPGGFNLPNPNPRNRKCEIINASKSEKHTNRLRIENLITTVTEETGSNGLPELTPKTYCQRCFSLPFDRDPLKKEKKTVSWKDFVPSTWVPDQKNAKKIKDTISGKSYWKEPRWVVWLKCIALMLASPIFHTLFSILGIVYNSLKILFLMTLGSFKGGIKELWKTLMQILKTPFTLVGLIFSSTFGLACPYTARKLYAGFERLQYGTYCLAPCFQPDADCHAPGTGGLKEKSDLT